MNSWCRWRCLQRPSTVPSSTPRSPLAAPEGRLVGREQGRGAVPEVIMRHGCRLIRLHRQSRLRAVEGLDRGFLVDRQHKAVRRRVDVEPNDVTQLGDDLRVPGQLEGSDRVRPEPMRAPDPWHRAAADPNHASHGLGRPVGRLVRGSVTVSSITRSITACGKGEMRAGRVLSRSSPSTPSAMNRACHRHTQGLDTPAWRLIASVPSPSAVARMIRARQTCFCGLFRSATTASKQARSPAPTSTLIPAPIHRTWACRPSARTFR
jgi:hypothetical protein